MWCFLVRVLPSLVAERIESVKAGLAGAIAFTVADLTAILLNNLIFVPWGVGFRLLQLNSLLDSLITIATALVSGFLFGVTYRYIIRSDRNSHLKDGAVMAFGLVRGLALLEATAIKSGQFWSLSILIAEGIISFAIARYCLDFALGKKFIKPFL
ncbi:hypothetical protein Xen7305DRAFT_00012280 [Xenococcus sp. PCC 7305]|uniref:hypothetical protein n=1 Tax=Xenococcus sp. PCC 7305 TaxID=102125 RepID=UPI0002ABE45C|nr:hypothetical protein [Xenococcus sp. PCC 7305]ELS01524.1 hypothetical protein Xen7305DRAFT_00012280 [Xenococcus sp. PCC 7305]